MKKILPRIMIILALALALGQPGPASAAYVQNWTENGLYGIPATYRTWDTAEAFLLSPGT